MIKPLESALLKRAAIRTSNLNLYTTIPTSSPAYYSLDELEAILSAELVGNSYPDMAVKSRSKFVKFDVCDALGYSRPKTFKRVKPRFTAQKLDVFAQSAKNLQVWGQEVDPTRRYAVVGIDESDVVTKVTVILGLQLADYDKTGKLTSKLQASFMPRPIGKEVVGSDTENIKAITGSRIGAPIAGSPTDYATQESLMSIEELGDKIEHLLERTMSDPGKSQDRNRGAVLHGVICELLGYHSYADSGQFPDITEQLLEIKLQTKQTIDLGLVLPSSKEVSALPAIEGREIRYCDVRYLVVAGDTDGETITVSGFVIVSGNQFFTRMRQFQGNVKNTKLQIPLPKSFWGEPESGSDGLLDLEE
ncbi:MAG: restriction endonuclease [Saprospiraceae bacterium]